MRNIIFILLLAFCFASCQNRNALPPGILDRNKMQAVLWDVISAEAYTNNYTKRDSTKKDPALEDAKLQHQIFVIHNTTKEEFYASYDYYTMHPELMSALLDSMSSSSTRRINQGGTSPFHGQFSDRHGHMPFFKDSLLRQHQRESNPVILKKP
ncbi:MAG TPA: DUF4296 domain-containing protein [Ferruginibacter sp.]|nr:DUF4296 domain-containing protein [Ferruginibacter sp.]